MVLAVIAATSGYVSTARAQVVVGSNKPPAVTVDSNVLDSLGAAPTLPQLFLGDRALVHPPRPATTSRTEYGRTERSRHVARRVATTHAPSKGIHLVPPSSQAAARAPAATHDETATQQKLAALAAPVPAPAPMPSLPQSSPPPPAPVLPPEPAHVVAPSAPATAPAQTAAAAPAAANPAPPPPAAPSTAASVPPAATPPAAVAMAAPAASTAAPTPAPAAGAAPPVQMAAATTVGSGLSAIKFPAGVTDLPPGPQPALDAVAARLLADQSLRVQVIAHATGSADEAMEARRVSLARAVAVRAYLINKGVRSLRIDVRALGNRADEGPVADQVDLMVVSQ